MIRRLAILSTIVLLACFGLAQASFAQDRFFAHRRPSIFDIHQHPHMNQKVNPFDDFGSPFDPFRAQQVRANHFPMHQRQQHVHQPPAQQQQMSPSQMQKNQSPPVKTQAPISQPASIPIEHVPTHAPASSPVQQPSQPQSRQPQVQPQTQTKQEPFVIPIYGAHQVPQTSQQVPVHDVRMDPTKPLMNANNAMPPKPQAPQMNIQRQPILQTQPTQPQPQPQDFQQVPPKAQPQQAQTKAQPQVPPKAQAQNQAQPQRAQDPFESFFNGKFPTLNLFPNRQAHPQAHPQAQPQPSRTQPQPQHAQQPPQHTQRPVSRASQTASTPVRPASVKSQPLTMDPEDIILIKSLPQRLWSNSSDQSYELIYNTHY
eukprot:TRINITY_DN8430_c0_g1::TRINITY_DN8430_c0_g1_i1::g.3480::m.3480 TRINITY_DN8430_c0_g1::TRINITY_DN8430_c0_g1_i1::g.3480  ORF type:complete len:371 (-),score=21.70 TRINITY_DN8430_c0_g1_i1:240-1352(-)